jgi:hypothetical protein
MGMMDAAVYLLHRSRETECTMVAIKKRHPEPDDLNTIPGVQLLDAEESRIFFDQQVRKVLNMSGDDFLRRWDSGEFRPVPDTAEGREIGRLVMLIPFVRPTRV